MPPAKARKPRVKKAPDVVPEKPRDPKEKTYELPCFICSKLFICSKYEVTTVITPPQPLCATCRGQFKSCKNELEKITEFYGEVGALGTWNQRLNDYLYASEVLCSVPVWYRAYFQFKDKVSHPPICRCGVCEHTKKTPPTDEQLEIVQAVQLAIFQSLFPESV